MRNLDVEYSASGEQQAVSSLRTSRKSHMESSCLLTSSGSSRSERSCRTSEPYVRVKISAFCRTNPCYTLLATNKDSTDKTIVAEYCAALTANEHVIQKAQFISDCTVTAAHIHKNSECILSQEIIFFSSKSSVCLQGEIMTEIFFLPEWSAL